jgi:uncharacterized OsmC-like protein
MTKVEVFHLENLHHEATGDGHSILRDEPKQAGGDGKGMNPYELLLSALGGCIAMTLRIYARHKGWPLEDVRVVLSHDKIHAKDCAECEHEDGMLDLIRRKVEIGSVQVPRSETRPVSTSTRPEMNPFVRGSSPYL